MKSNRMSRAIGGLLILGAGGTVNNVAHAQSSITLYGILDSGVEYVSHAAKKGQGSLFRLNTGNRINSRWGLTGLPFQESTGHGRSGVFAAQT